VIRRDKSAGGSRGRKTKFKIFKSKSALKPRMVFKKGLSRSGIPKKKRIKIVVVRKGETKKKFRKFQKETLMWKKLARVG